MQQNHSLVHAIKIESKLSGYTKGKMKGEKEENHMQIKSIHVMYMHENIVSVHDLHMCKYSQGTLYICV